MSVLSTGSRLIGRNGRVFLRAPTNQVPTDITLSGSSIVFNANSGTDVGTLGVVDPGDTQWTFSIVSQSAGNPFQLTSAGPAATTILERSGTGTITQGVSESVTIQVTDSASNVFQKTFTISVVAAPVGPTDIALSGSGILDNATGGTVIGTLTHNDPDTLSVTWTIVTQPAGLTLTLSGANPAISRNLVYGSGTLTPGSATVRIRASDGTTSYEEDITFPILSSAGQFVAQTTTVAITDTLAAGARTDVPFFFGVPLLTGGTDTPGTGASLSSLRATVGGVSQNIGVGARCVTQSNALSYAIVGGVLDSLPSGGTQNVVVSTVQDSDPSGTGITWADVLAATNASAQTWNCTVQIDSGGVTYTADPRTVTTSNTTYSASGPYYSGQWIDTPHFAAFSVNVPFLDGSNNRVNDKLRCRFDVYAWKKQSGPISGSNPIIAIMAEPEIEIASWNEAVTGTACTALRVRDHTATAVNTFTGSPTFTLFGYGATDMGLNGIWWSNTTANRGGWEPIHQNTNGRLDFLFDRGWLLPMSLTKPLVNRTVTGFASLPSFNTQLNAQSTLPMQAAGIRNASQVAGGAWPYINLIHQAELFAAHSWDDATARSVARRNASRALHQRQRFGRNGLLLDMASADGTRSIPAGAAPVATLGAPPSIPDQAHKDYSGFLLWLLEGRLKWLRHLHYDAQYMWAETDGLAGVNRGLFASGGGQGRGRMGWSVRNFVCTVAATPNTLPATTTGWTRSLMQTMMDNSCGTANQVVTPGLLVYSGTKDEYWDASRPGAITPNNRYDNDDPENARWLFQTGTNGFGLRDTNIFAMNFAVLSHAQGSRLNVFNADGISQRDWVFEAYVRMVTNPQADGMIEWYWGFPWNAHVIAPKTWAQFWHDSNGAARYGAGAAAIAPRFLPGLTGFSINATNPAAVVITLIGGTLPFFDDGEQNVGGARGDWFAARGRWAGRGPAAWVQGSSPNSWLGRVTSVSADGRSCTIDCTVLNGVAPSSSPSNVALTSLALPMYGPASPWVTDNIYVLDATNDYTTSGCGSIKMIKLVAPPRNLDAIDAKMRARTLLRTQGGGDGAASPLNDTSNLTWVYGSDW